MRFVAHFIGLAGCAFAYFAATMFLADTVNAFAEYGHSVWYMMYDEQANGVMAAAGGLGASFAVWTLFIAMSRPEAGQPMPARPGSLGAAFGWSALALVLLGSAGVVLLVSKRIVGNGNDPTLLGPIPGCGLALVSLAPSLLAVRTLVRLGKTPATGYSPGSLFRVFYSIVAILLGALIALAGTANLRDGTQLGFAYAVATGLVLGGLRGLLAPLFRKA